MMANHPTSRRQLFGGTASLMLLASSAAGAAKATELDGELITAATEYAHLQDEFSIVCAQEDLLPVGPEKEAAAARMEAIEDRQADLRGAMCDMQARTPEGIRAKAVAARCCIADGDSRATKPINDEEWLVWSLLDDLLGRAPA